MTDFYQTKRINQGRTKCPLCDKEFTNDSYFEVHLKTKHGFDTVSLDHCLADYCDIFPCETTRIKTRIKNKDRD